MEGGDVWLAWVVNAMYRPVLGRVKSVIPGMEKPFVLIPLTCTSPRLLPSAGIAQLLPKEGLGAAQGCELPPLPVLLCRSQM